MTSSLAVPACKSIMSQFKQIKLAALILEKRRIQKDQLIGTAALNCLASFKTFFDKYYNSEYYEKAGFLVSSYLDLRAYLTLSSEERSRAKLIISGLAKLDETAIDQNDISDVEEAYDEHGEVIPGNNFNLTAASKLQKELVQHEADTLYLRKE